MAKKFPILPVHPERICWGCDRYCASNSMMCGNGSIRTPHPSELFGEGWIEFGLEAAAPDGNKALEGARVDGPTPPSESSAAFSVR